MISKITYIRPAAGHSAPLLQIWKRQVAADGLTEFIF